MSLIRIDFQPNFPKEDIDSSNERAIQALLYDPSYIKQAHESARRHSNLCRLSHKAISTLIEEMEMEASSENSKAINFGVAVYEMVSLALRQYPADYNTELVTEKAVEVVAMKDLSKFDTAITLTEIERDFSSTMPRSADAVNLAVESMPGVNPQYARMGAALQCKIEKDIITKSREELEIVTELPPQLR